MNISLLNKPALAVGLLTILIAGGCDDAPKKPKASASQKPAGAAKDIKASYAPPVNSAATLEGGDNRRPTAPPSKQSPADESPAVQQPIAQTKTIPEDDRFARIMLRPTYSEPIVPEFRQPTEQEVAAMALGRIGRAAVPELIRVLDNPNPEARQQAALVLARIGPDAEEAVPELTRMLDDEDEEVRKAAARALGQIGPAAAIAVPALKRLLVPPKPFAPRR